MDPITENVTGEAQGIFAKSTAANTQMMNCPDCNDEPCFMCKNCENSNKLQGSVNNTKEFPNIEKSIGADFQNNELRNLDNCSPRHHANLPANYTKLRTNSIKDEIKGDSFAMISQQKKDDGITCPKCEGKGGWFCMQPEQIREATESNSNSIIYRYCPACDGIKKLPSTATKCDQCHGMGFWNEDSSTPQEWDSFMKQVACSKCNGKCFLNVSKYWFAGHFMMCPVCHGLGGWSDNQPVRITDDKFEKKCPCCSGKKSIPAGSIECQLCWGKGQKRNPEGGVNDCEHCNGACYVRPVF